jgi:signal transduction histidine kinase
MQQAGTAAAAGKRVETMQAEAAQAMEAVTDALASPPGRGRGESLAEVAHDARNMVAALDLYCDLLDQPGVLGAAFAHYAGELRLVAAASRRLVEKLAAFEDAGQRQLSLWRNGELRNGGNGAGGGRCFQPAAIHLLPAASLATSFREPLPSQLVASLAAELQATRSLLAALAGPSIALAVDIDGGALPARISVEDLTRILVNLVKNAVEAMPDGGELRISLRERTGCGHPRLLRLAVEDSGPGIPPEALELIFAAGYTAPAAQTAARTAARTASRMPADAAMAPHRGLGLSITRSIVEAAGGRIFAENRPRGGARIVMELPAGEEKNGSEARGREPDAGR